MNVAVNKPKIRLEFKDKTPINIKQGIETLKEIAASNDNKQKSRN
jgi:hypothetical protein